MATEVCMELSRHFDLLNDTSRFKRKKSLETIQEKLNVALKNAEKDDFEKIALHVITQTKNSLSDSVEKHREMVVNIISELISKTFELKNLLSIIIPTLVSRIGQQEIIELSEEIRLALINIIFILLKNHSKQCIVFVSELISILAITTCDPFAEIKKESCKCIILLSEKSENYFSMSCEKLVKPILSNFIHQHSKVRVEAIKALGSVFLNGNSKQMDDAVPYLAQRLFDDSGNVRLAVIQITGNWLLNLMDRYSYHTKLIPLLLTGITDELLEIKTTAENFWFDIGIKFEKENEDDLRDKQDYQKPPPSRYPNEMERPNLGCRILISRCLSRILPALTGDLTDWKVETRIKASQLLPTLALNAEECMTQHAEVLLNSAYRCIVDEEIQVRVGVEQGLKIVAYFMEPGVWWRLISVRLQRADATLRGVLAALSCLLRGADPVSLSVLPLTDVCSALVHEDVAHTVLPEVKWQLLGCFEALLVEGAAMPQDLPNLGRFLYYMLCSVLSVTVKTSDAEDNVYASIIIKCRHLMEVMTEKFGLPSVLSLHRMFLPDMFSNFVNCYAQWTRTSPKRLMFECLCLEAGPVVGELLKLVLPILQGCLDINKDAQFRLGIFLLFVRLAARLDESLNSTGEFVKHFLPELVRKTLLPNLQWRAGRTAEAVRRLAMTTLWTLLQRLEVCDVSLAEDMRPILASVLDDDSSESRLLAVKCLRRVLALVGCSMERDPLHQLYPAFLKRMDDSNDEIRITTCKLLLTWIEALRFGFDVSLYRAHLEDLYRGLLVHLDDGEEKVQRAVLEVLINMGNLLPELLKEMVEKARHRHRSQNWCDELVQALDESVVLATKSDIVCNSTA